MNKHSYKLQRNPDSYDHNDIVFSNTGCGYIGKNSKKIGLLRCPECERENYSMAVSSGQCASCGWDANENAEEVK